MTETHLRLLEIGVTALTPILVLIFGYYIKKQLKVMESNQAAKLAALKSDKERVFQKKRMRKTIYEELADKLNIIYCYVNDVGDYGEHEPDDIIELKRYVDRRFKVYESLWSDKTRERFDEFIKASFFHFRGGTGKAALINASTQEKSSYAKNTGKQWKNEWDARFSGKKDPEISSKYWNMSKAFLDDFID
jgi:hypothetical protein